MSYALPEYSSLKKSEADLDSSISEEHRLARKKVMVTMKQATDRLKKTVDEVLSSTPEEMKRWPDSDNHRLRDPIHDLLDMHYRSFEESIVWLDKAICKHGAAVRDFRKPHHPIWGKLGEMKDSPSKSDSEKDS